MLKKKWIALIAAGMVGVSCLMGSTVMAEAPQRSITVSGEATVTAKPDIATVNISVETSSPNAKAAARENANTMSAVRSAVIAAGADAAGIETNNYNLYPEQVYKDGEPKIKGYKCDNSMKVTVRNLSLTGSVMDAAVKAGANRIDSVDFRVSNPESFKNQALRQATADAYQKAKVIAAALGRNIINVYGVTESTNNVVPYRLMRVDAVGEAKAAATTPIEPGDAQIKSEVTAVFEVD